MLKHVKTYLRNTTDQQDENEADVVPAVENQIIAHKPIDVISLSPDSSASFNFPKIYRTIKMKLTSTFRVFEMKCPQLEHKFIELIFLHIGSTLCAEALPFIFRGWSDWVNIEFIM